MKKILLTTCVLTCTLTLTSLLSSAQSKDGLKLGDLQEFWIEMYQNESDDAFDFGILEFEQLAKAPKDGCYFGIGDTLNYYEPSGIDCEECLNEGGTVKTNQSYLWGMTKENNKMWYGSNMNYLCLLPGEFGIDLGPYEGFSYHFYFTCYIFFIFLL
ncbi:MAG: hypothetical protein B6I19_03820 [Bacteroidetes bacterium 4572_114]|nr:MAG: hypothetical protein B6I19_03820 [Bacteroidetes bacterium 4572_114]